ncbi:sigma-54 interaction domain-containing protein [Cupriavidus taiwanensis]|uniref:sigma-54 interaction domain-containing protein n=1 Tax=Cupriavidus taiwanensis TaxID=164546 RepID=UPI0039C0A1A6
MPFPELSGNSESRASFLKLVLDHVSDCLVAVDTDGMIVLINEPYCKLLGGTEADFLGRHITEVVSPHTRLHKVARGEEVVGGAPLQVRGCKLITRQVPVLHEGRIVGAVGLALFSNYELLKRTYALAFSPSIALQNARSGWTTQHTADDILGTGPEMDALRQQIRVASSHAFPTLLQGETGTGKELAAHAIHSGSDRAQRPFVWVNCASIPEQLIDAELFGYEGGAFTGASSRGKPGKFELASGGTLFLDEIGDMPMALQTSLLRAIQHQQIVRVGGTSPLDVDVRIICATHHNLAQSVEDGRFRADLYFRLAMFRIALPALRERSDLQGLITQLYARLLARHGLAPRTLSVSVLNALTQHSWPGNVRELEGVLIRYNLDGRLDLSDVMTHAGHVKSAGPVTYNLHTHLEREKAAIIAAALQHCAQDRNRAAALLGISRASLYRELQAVRLKIFADSASS